MQESGAESPIREKIAGLTRATYRVTGLFPAGDPLSKKLRESAVEVLAGALDFLISGKKGNAALGVGTKIEIMREYLCSADGSLAGVNPLNFTILEREYGILAGFFDMEEEAYDARGAKEEQSIKDRGDRGPKKQEATAVAVPSEHLARKPERASERQTAILAYLNQARQAKIGDFSSLFTAVSLKTIQRDLQDLVAKNILRKEGERRWTVYVRNDVL